MKKISNKGGILINNFPSSQPLLYQNNSSFTYEELNTKLVEESPKYDIWGLLSNIGGTLGTDFTKFYPIQFDITVLIPYRKKTYPIECRTLYGAYLLTSLCART